MAKKNGDRIVGQLRTRLLALRDARGLTNVDWAYISKQTPHDVRRFALGEMVFPPLDFLDALCRVFHSSLADMLSADLPKYTFTQAEQNLVDEFRLLTPGEQHAFETVLYRRPKPNSGR